MTGNLTPRVARGAVALAVVVAVMVYVGTDGDGVVGTTCYLGVLVGASVGAWIGAERAPRGQRLVPRLIATGISLTALGDVLWDGLDLIGARTDVSIADPPWFTSYVFLIAALWVVLKRTRGRSGDRLDVDFMIDLLTILVVTMLIFWSFSVEGIVADDSLSPMVRAVWAAYPIADGVLLALVVRLLMCQNARARVGVSFGAGVLLWLAADVAYLRVTGDGVVSLLMGAAWMVAPVLLARAAWRASATQPVVPGSSAVNGLVVQVVVAISPLLVPPALELAIDLRGKPDQPLLFLIGTTALIALAIVRTARLIRSEERARRELEGARDAALEASRAKSMFLANMSHEIRTPLTTVLAAGDILESTSLTELQSDLLKKMNRSGELLKALVQGLLDFSRIEAGKLELTSAVFDLHTMATDVADVYGPRAIQAGIRFEWHVDQAVPRMVVGDQGRLFQVLTNLLDNALKFTQQGHVGLIVRPADVGAEGEGAVTVVDFIVEDTGVGIAAEEQGSVFEAFHQVDGSTTRRYGGTGLGLAICKELTELMGGSISLQSRFGAGSRFVIRIPFGCPVEAPAGTRQAVPVTT